MKNSFQSHLEVDEEDAELHAGEGCKRFRKRQMSDSKSEVNNEIAILDSLAGDAEISGRKHERCVPLRASLIYCSFVASPELMF